MLALAVVAILKRVRGVAIMSLAHMPPHKADNCRLCSEEIMMEMMRRAHLAETISPYSQYTKLEWLMQDIFKTIDAVIR